MKKRPVGRRLVSEGMAPLIWMAGSLAYVAGVFSFHQTGLALGGIMLLLIFTALGAKTALFLAGKKRFGDDVLMALLVVLSVKALEQALAWGVCAPGDPYCSASFQGLEFLVFAFLAIYHRPLAMAAFAVYAAVIQVGYAAGPALLDGFELYSIEAALPNIAARFAFNLAFGVGFGIFIRNEREGRQRAVGELDRLEREAQGFRLQSVVAEPEAGLEAISRAGRVEAGKRAVHRLRQKEYEIARFVKRTLKCYSAVIFRLDPVSRTLELRAWATDSRTISQPLSIPVGQGIIGWIQREQEILQLGESARPLADLPYYTGDDEGIYSFLGAPILGQESCLGVIVVDSREVGVFGEEHRNTLEIASRMVYDAVQNEELRSRQETEALQLQAMMDLSRQVSDELDVAEICKRVIVSMFRIVPYRLAAVTLWDEESREYLIEYAAEGDDEAMEAPEWMGKTFTETDETVVNFALRQDGVCLIDNYRRRDRSKRLPVLAPGMKLPEMDSILAIPLLHRGQRVGCLVLGAEGNDVFEETERRLFGILANLFASALLNASKHRATETRATTDLLTKLANRVRFKDFFAEAIAAARQDKLSVSVLLMDIDFFKKVNDTYGHVAGDAILVQVANILRASTRETDLAFRFGGEEFLIVCPNTSRKDAARLGDRIRKAMEKTPFEIPDGRVLKVTMSVGVATFPGDTQREDQLTDMADQALYGAKTAGRNRVQQYCDLPDQDGTDTWTQPGDTADAEPETEPEPTGSGSGSGGGSWRFG